MRHSYRPDIPPPPQPYRTQVLDHLGLVAGMFEELGITEVIDRATQQDPAMRIVTVGHALSEILRCWSPEDTGSSSARASRHHTAGSSCRARGRHEVDKAGLPQR